MGNASPQFCKNGRVDGVAITAANTKSDGTGTIGIDIFLALLADAANGSYVESVRFMPTASAAATATAATVARVFASSRASGATTNADTHLLAEIVLPAVTADSPSAANYPLDVPLGFRLPAGSAILVTTHAAPNANTGWKATVFGGDY